jgi:Protein of unknown function (DUF1173)
MQDANPAQCAPASPSAYWIGGHRLTTDSPHFPDAIATAHATHQRPLCLCQPNGITMYVARLAGAIEAHSASYIVKRMPSSGSQHAPQCASYEPPADSSGLGQVLGSAITENPATGETTLKLGFSMSKISGRHNTPTTGSDADSVASDGTKLTLRGLLHYLWDQAELTRWHPGFAGKRTWATVRKHLLQAAQNKTARGGPLQDRLYIPEPFWPEQREAINARRTAQWSQAIAFPGAPQSLMLVIAEVKEIVPARYGFKAVVKHVPDQAFTIDEQLYRRLGRRFATELTLWGAADDIHMVMIATFSVAAAGIPTIMELSLMPVTRQWLPVEDGFEKQLIDKLVTEGRSFVKGLRYNLGAGSAVAAATLTDCEGSAPMLFVGAAGIDITERDSELQETGAAVWPWQPTAETMPALPTRAANSTVAAQPATQ